MFSTLTFIATPNSIFSPVFTASSRHRIKTFMVSFKTEPINKCDDKSFFSLSFIIPSWHQTKSHGDQNKRLFKLVMYLKMHNICFCTSYSLHDENVSFKRFWMATIYIVLVLPLTKIDYKGVTQGCFFFGNVSEVQRLYMHCKVDTL